MDSPQVLSRKNKIILLFFMGLCAIGFIVSLVLFIRQVGDVRYKGPIHPHNPLGIFLSGSREPLSQSGVLDVDNIDVWMTFSYINFRFQLPPNLLKEQLKIDDTKYPNISLKGYTKKKKLDSALFLTQLKNIISNLPPSIPPK